jgi:hypothetical protein
MLYLLDQLQSDVKRKGSQLDMEHVDLVIEPKALNHDSVIGNYYFANHRGRCLFWLDEFDAKDVLSECKGIKTLSHKGGWLTSPSWSV